MLVIRAVLNRRFAIFCQIQIVISSIRPNTTATTTTTTMTTAATVLQPFVLHYPGEPVPEG